MRSAGAKMEWWSGGVKAKCQVPSARCQVTGDKMECWSGGVLERRVRNALSAEWGVRNEESKKAGI